MNTAVERALSHGLLKLPATLLLGIVRQPPTVVEGQTLDYQIQFGLALEARRQRTPLYDMPPEQARTSAATAFAVFDVERRELDSVRDWMADVDGREPVPVRVYTPASPCGGMLVFFHGGGGVIGSVDAYDDTCRYLADTSQCVVVSVDYRLAPEHPFPAGPDDAMTAYLWARRHAARLGADPNRVAVGGDSMGGNFAAVLCLRCKAEGAPMPAYQWLIYPGTEMTCSAESHRTFAEGYVLEGRLIEWFLHLYLGDHDRRDPMTSPLYAEDLSGLPPALLVTAGYDPLRDEGRAYADKLQMAGSAVRYVCHPGLVHGFVQMGGAIGSARDAIDDAVRALRSALDSAT